MASLGILLIIMKLLIIIIIEEKIGPASAGSEGPAATALYGDKLKQVTNGALFEVFSTLMRVKVGKRIPGSRPI